MEEGFLRSGVYAGKKHLHGGPPTAIRFILHVCNVFSVTLRDILINKTHKTIVVYFQCVDMTCTASF